MCGCGSDGQCHFCNSSDFIGYIDENLTINSTGGAFGTNGMSCSNNIIVNNIPLIEITLSENFIYPVTSFT